MCHMWIVHCVKYEEVLSCCNWQLTHQDNDVQVQTASSEPEKTEPTGVYDKDRQ